MPRVTYSHVGLSLARLRTSASAMCTHPSPLRHVTYFLMTVSIISVTGCGERIIIQKPANSLTIHGPSEVRIGDTASFTTTLRGVTSGPLVWSVNGVVGGSTTIGTISANGIYTPPITPTVAEIESSLPEEPSVKASISVSILNPLPLLTSGTQATADSEGIVIDLIGKGFVPESSASAGSVSIPTLFVSSTELRVSVPTSIPSHNSITLAVSNPSPGPSTSNPITIIVAAALGSVPAGAVEEMNGCTNPNIGSPSEDWGVGTDPVYSPWQNETAVGEPQYEENAIFWVSRETSPGQSVLMTGAFTRSPKSVRVAISA